MKNMEKEPRHLVESAEQFKWLDLTIHEPDTMHGNFGIVVDTKKESESLSEAYNRAVEAVAEEHGLRPFHQSGTGGKFPNGPNWHFWEFWKKSSADEVEKLFPLIHERASQNFSELRD